MTVVAESLQQQPKLTPDQLAEPVGREVFRDHPDAAFYIGVIATPGVVEDPSVYAASSRFRANVYIDDMDFLDESARSRRGWENDANDKRSVHFSVVENMGQDAPARVTGFSRLILKDENDAPLPVEHFFPEAFKDAPAPASSSEVSRLMARHSDRATQGIISLGLIRAMTSYTVEKSRQPAFAIVERGLTVLFKRMGLPYEILSDLKYIPEYNTKNMAISIDPEKVADSIRPEHHVAGRPEMSNFFSDMAQHHGLGFFDRNLMEVK